MDKKSIDNRMIITAIIAVIVSAITAHSGIVSVAMAVGFIVSMVFCFCYFKYVNIKTTMLDILAAIAGSQMGWVALLI